MGSKRTIQSWKAEALEIARQFPTSDDQRENHEWARRLSVAAACMKQMMERDLAMAALRAPKEGA
jgi:hypothetical protein